MRFWFSVRGTRTRVFLERGLIVRSVAILFGSFALFACFYLLFSGFFYIPKATSKER